MPRNFKELQEKMDPALRSDNQERLREVLQRMLLRLKKSAKQ